MGLGSSRKLTSINWNSTVTSPFKSITRELYPETMQEVLAWAEELWLHHGLYSQAINKAVRYFMTDVEIGNSEGSEVSYQTRVKYKKFLTSRYDLMSTLSGIGDEVIAFGNSFTSIYVPFIRNLSCPVCGFSAPLKEMYEYVSWENFTFKGTCPGIDCGYKGVFRHMDLKLPPTELVPEIVKWPPQLMGIKKHPVSGRTVYTFNVMENPDLIKGLKNGDPVYLEDTPWEMIEAVKAQKPMEFYPGEIYHMANQLPSYIQRDMGGWGLPLFMAEFENAVMVMLLDKYNEVIISDYVIPFRVISPPQNNPALAGSSDPMLNIGGANFVKKAKQMLTEHRRNPSGFNFFPFPVSYQMLGGEAKSLTPVELLEHMEMRLLHSMGIPQEMYTASIQASAGPLIGFKMFERVWQHVLDNLNGWLQWFTDKNGELFQWESVDIKLIPVSILEDEVIRHMKFDLASSRQISKSTMMRSLNIDSEYERKRVIEEEEEEERIMQEKKIKAERKGIAMGAVRAPAPGEEILMAEQQAAQQQGGIGAPMHPQGSPSMQGLGEDMRNASIDELNARAEQLAVEIFQMPSSQRISTLLDLGKTNETLHAQVKQKLAKIEQDASKQGLDMARQGQM